MPIGGQVDSLILSDDLSHTYTCIGESNEKTNMSKVQEYDFRHKYSIPKDIEIRFPANPLEVIDMSCPGRSCSSLYLPPKNFEARLRLPLPSLVHQFLHYTYIHLIHIHLNIICVLVGIYILNFMHDMDLDLNEVLFIYSLKLLVKGKFSLYSNSRSLQLVMGFPQQTRVQFMVML